MDLSSIQAAPIEVPIAHPGTGEPTGLVLRVVSPQDPSAAAARRTLQDRVTRKKGATDADIAEYMAALVVGWDWNGDSSWKGEKLAFSSSNVRSVMAESWVRAQVDEAIGDYSAFFRK